MYENGLLLYYFVQIATTDLPQVKKVHVRPFAAQNAKSGGKDVPHRRFSDRTQTLEEGERNRARALLGCPILQRARTNRRSTSVLALPNGEAARNADDLGPAIDQTIGDRPRIDRARGRYTFAARALGHGKAAVWRHDRTAINARRRIDHAGVFKSDRKGKGRRRAARHLSINKTAKIGRAA
jgi:hypothetical protein